MKFYIDAVGNYLGGWDDGPPPGSIEVEMPPIDGDQPWLFPGWGPSPSKLRRAEDQWRDDELLVIADQLDAIEEAEVNAAPVDLLPGARQQWLKYRGAVRNWTQGKDGYPDITKRPKRPT